MTQENEHKTTYEKLRLLALNGKQWWLTPLLAVLILFLLLSLFLTGYLSRDFIYNLF